MFSLEIACEPRERDFLIADLWEQGCAGISELDDALRVFFEEDAARERLLARYPGAALRAEEPRDWVQAARDLLQPMAIGRRFFLVPEWRDEPAPQGRFRITVNPGMAFGTGVHETTRLCLEALEEFVRPGMAVLDVGTGSGILAQAAGLLGADKVFACDVDPDAVAIARQRVRDAFVGSADAVRSGTADLLVANITPEVVIGLMPDLLRVLRPAGMLLASGFEGNEAETVARALPAIREIRRMGNWSLIAALGSEKP